MLQRKASPEQDHASSPPNKRQKLADNPSKGPDPADADVSMSGQEHKGQANVSKVIKLHGVEALKKLNRNSNPGQRSSEFTEKIEVS